MAWVKYRSDETIACAAWGCYVVSIFVFTIVFVFTVLPTLSEEMSWTKDECFVVSHNTTCLDLRLSYCGPSADVFLLSRSENNLVCTTVSTGPVCTYQMRTINAPASTGWSWIEDHKINETYDCWERTQSDNKAEASFDSLMTSGSMGLLYIPILSSAVFFISAAILVPAFVSPEGLGGRILGFCGIAREVVVEDDAEAEARTMIAESFHEGGHMSGILMDAPNDRSRSPMLPLGEGTRGERAAIGQV
eukprot:CAMPEP_0180151538 /NCGR_PEP_ID=MMETSP0986-20121125/22194_1 /TAXON_ID=697907 /ORGANISM="non described non described, Strain CCMP2293" /LENGTH=247 /DNA_ID=CAMNT_0022098863 /DNA_START=150 /DNA_END=893 /DNA_ORIENTATION=+